MITLCKAGIDFKGKFRRALQKKTQETRRLVGFGRRVEGMPDYRTEEKAPEYMLIVTDSCLSEDDKYFLLKQFIETMGNNLVWNETRFVLADYNGGIQINTKRHRLSQMRSMIENRDIPAITCNTEENVELKDAMLDLVKKGTPLILFLSSITEIEKLKDVTPNIANKLIALAKDNGQEYEKGVFNKLNVFLIQPV